MATGRPDWAGLGMGQQPYALPGSCTSSSLAPSLLVAASDVYRKIKWTRGSADPWQDLQLPILDEWAADRVNGVCHIVIGISCQLLCTSPLLGQVRVPGEGGTLFGVDGAPHSGSQQLPRNQKQLPCWGTRSISKTGSKSRWNRLCFGIATTQETRLS